MNMAQDDWGVMIGIRPTPTFRPWQTQVPKEIKVECQKFVHHLKGIPNVYVDDEWVDSEYGFFDLIIVGAKLAASVATITATALAIHNFLENRKKKTEKEKRPIRVVMTLSKRYYWNPRTASKSEVTEILESETKKSIERKLEIFGTTLLNVKTILNERRKEKKSYSSR